MEINCIICGFGPLGKKAQIKGLCKSCSIKKTLHDKADEIKAKKRATCLRKYGVEHQMLAAAVAKKVADTTCERYGGIGFASAELSKKVADTCEKKHKNKNFKNKEKQLQTKIEKYGDQNFNNREQAKETSLERYGVQNVMQNKEIHQRATDTCQEKYGVDNPWQAEEVKEKIKLVKIKRYGTANNFSELQKAVQEKYGVDNIAKIPEVKQKLSLKAKENNTRRLETLRTICLEKYGVDHPSKRPEVIQKMSETALNRTPEKWREMAQKRTFKQKSIINGIQSESSWEKAFIETHSGCVRGPVIPYEIEGKIHHWIIDFEWDGKLYEIKNPWMLNPKNTWSGNSNVKFSLSKDLNIFWYIWKPQSLLFEAQEQLAKYITWPGMLDIFFTQGFNEALFQAEKRY